MTLIKWNNGKSGSLVDRNYFPSLITDFFGSMPYEDLDFTPTRGRLPSVNIAEEKDHFSIELAAPGLQKSDFKISVEEGILKIESESTSKNQEKKDNYTRREFSYSSFKRSFSVPETVNTEKIEAIYIDGILTINLPKKDEVASKVSTEIVVK